MANYYKRYELSRSLNGNKIIYIARNAVGNVVFRESSEENLKKAIDELENQKPKEEEQKEEEVIEPPILKEEAPVKGKKALTNKLQAAVEEKRAETKSKRASFWDRLK